MFFWKLRKYTAVDEVFHVDVVFGLSKTDLLHSIFQIHSPLYNLTGRLVVVHSFGCHRILHLTPNPGLMHRLLLRSAPVPVLHVPRVHCVDALKAARVPDRFRVASGAVPSTRVV